MIVSDELKHTLDETRWNKVYIASTECIDWVYQNQKIMDQWVLDIFKIATNAYLAGLLPCTAYVLAL